MLEVVRCGTRPSSRVRDHTPPVQYLLRGGYKLGLNAFQGGQRPHGRFGTPKEEKGSGEREEATVGESVLTTPFWSMLYADDAGVISQLSEQLKKMMGVSLSCAQRLASPYRRPRLRSGLYARRGCRSPSPHSAKRQRARCTTR